MFKCLFQAEEQEKKSNILAALHNTQKQTQGGCQNEETKKHSPNERTDQNSEKRAKQNGDKQSIRGRVHTPVIRMFKELSQGLNSVQKDSVRNKGYTN